MSEPILTEERAREIGKTFQRFAEQTEQQFCEYRDALVKALEAYRDSDLPRLIVSRDHVKVLIAQARELKLGYGTLSQNETEGQTAEAAYEFGDELHSFLSRTDLPDGLKEFGQDLQLNGVLLAEKASESAITIMDNGKVVPISSARRQPGWKK